MTRQPVWTAIRDTLATEIAGGQYRLGDRLPTEADLSARFGVNRHTVRRALADLAASGTVHARRGAGVFVAATPTDYPIGRRTRFHQSLREAGRLPGKDILLIETRRASPDEAAALRLPDGTEVHCFDGLSLADGQPIAVFRSVFPAARFPRLPTLLATLRSVTAALAAEGVADFTRASTRITARAATPMQALHLRIPDGAPVLRTRGINIDAQGQPVEYGQTWFAGDRVTLTVADL